MPIASLEKIANHLKGVVEQGARFDERLKAIDARISDLRPSVKTMLALANETRTKQESLEHKISILSQELSEVRSSLADARERLARNETMADGVEERLIARFQIAGMRQAMRGGDGEIRPLPSVKET